MIYKYDVSQLRRLIAWQFFNFTWGVTRASDEEKESLRRDADAILDSWQGRYFSHAVINKYPAYSVDDDIVIGGVTIPMLRQQSGDFLSLADFVQPKHMGEGVLGAFATTFDSSIPELQSSDPYERMMAQVLCDRLAEATAEMVSIEMPGIRPAVGYPSIPDMGINFLLGRLVDFKSIGIQLTETGMMNPHASVSGLIFPHPKAHYFYLGTIGDDQLADYARRRGLTLEEIRRFIRNN